MTQAHEESYIRGAVVEHVDGRRAFIAVAAVVLTAMLAVTAYLFASTASANDSAENLARSGMTVTATITGCEGISDGVGMGVEYYECTARVTAGGRSYEGLLHDSRVSRHVGSQVQAIMVPGDASTLTLDRARPSSYIPAAVMAAASVVALVALLVFLRRRRFRRPAPELRAT